MAWGRHGGRRGPRRRRQTALAASALPLLGAVLAAPFALSRGDRAWLAPNIAGRTPSVRCSRTPCRWSFFGFGDNEKPELGEAQRSRFFSYAEGEDESARLKQSALRSLLECTETFCLAKHWLPESYVEGIYAQYAGEDGISLEDFSRLASDGVLLEGKLEEYEQAFNGMDVARTGVISREALGKLFAGLGRVMPPEELDRIVAEADVDRDGIDFADFLGLARTHLDLSEVLGYLATHTMPLPESGLPVDLSADQFATQAGLQEVTVVHGEAELNAIISNGADAVVKLAFTWCRPCKAFLPKFQKFAKLYKNTRFVKIVGNENESCKHYAREVLKAKISPMFAAYSKGRLVKTWHGANNGRFIENMEESLPSAASLSSERELAVAADSQIAPLKA